MKAKTAEYLGILRLTRDGLDPAERLLDGLKDALAGGLEKLLLRRLDLAKFDLGCSAGAASARLRIGGE